MKSNTAVGKDGPVADTQHMLRGDRIYFITAILGFSFWFFVAVPFASHRETYGWLAGSMTQTLVEQVQFGQSSTYRPIPQVVIFFLFQWLDPSVFPTSSLRQTVLQSVVYVAFVIAWWVIFQAASCRRTFALTALIAGAVLFSGYVHLFHIYGLMYVPVIGTMAAMIYLQASSRLERYAPWVAAATAVLVLWHPFAAAIFVACYVGYAAEVFHVRTAAWLAKTLLVLAIPAATVFVAVVLAGRDSNAVDSRLAAFLASYRTNEVNLVVSATVMALSCLAAASMARSARPALAAVVFAVAVGCALIASGVPVLLLWFGIVLVKLARARTWSLFCLMFAMTLLPFGGATGTPIHTLFAIVVAVYGTALWYDDAESALAVVKPQYALAMIAVAAVVVVLMRTGKELPVLSRVASPLLGERERTFQLERVLAWMRDSQYCGSAIAFIDPAGSPVDSIESAINRQHRPPAAIADVRMFWNSVLRCEPRDERTAVVTFGGPAVEGSVKVYELTGTYAHPAAVWILPVQAQERQR